jgi:DNA gyrase subunit A
MTIGAVRKINIDQEMRESYLDYAMSVIVSRALPDARDGLKPVHRRILYAMYDMGLRNNTPHRKSARIVGEVLGKYHPHGDAAVYDTMVRLAQDFSMRYMLVDGQGNFGSIDGDSAAAMRYTEARMAAMGEELLVDIDKDTVTFVENFDGSLEEPAVLPSSVPNLLVNGASGIAVGMSTSIPPHNLVEVCQALEYMLNNWETLDDITTEDLMTFIQGPDFPTGGLVYRHKDGLKTDNDTLLTAYATGRGKITVRAKVYVEDIGRGRSQVIITELPYQTNKSSLIERIASLVRDGRIEGITDLRDESDRQGLRIVIQLGRGSDSNEIISALFKLTPLQDTFSINMLALVNGQPRVLSLKQALKVYIDHRLEVIRRRSEYELEKAKARAHILEGLLKALDDLDNAIAIIRKSRRVDTARTNLMRELKVTELQAQAILDMQLRRLAALERKKIEEEYAELVVRIAYLEGLLQSDLQMRDVVKGELAEKLEAYYEPRRSIIVDEIGTAKVSAADFMVPEEDLWLTVTTTGKVAALNTEEPPRPTTSDKEPPRFILQSTTQQTLYLFTSRGAAATIPVQQIGIVGAPADGTAFADLCSLSSDETIVGGVSLPAAIGEGYLFLSTRSDQVKRLRLGDLPGLTNKVFTVMKVDDDDALGWVFPTTGENEVMLVTMAGQAIRFEEDNVRPTGLPSGGVRGVKLQGEGDGIVGAFVLPDNSRENQLVWNITDDGIAKVSPLTEYPTQGRAGQGVISMRLPEMSVGVVAAAVGHPDDNIIVLTTKDKPKYMRIGLAEMVKRGRVGYGERVIAMRDSEQVAGVVMYQAAVELVVSADVEPGA